MVGRRFAGPTLHKFPASPRKNATFAERKATIIGRAIQKQQKMEAAEDGRNRKPEFEVCKIGVRYVSTGVLCGGTAFVWQLVSCDVSITPAD